MSAEQFEKQLDRDLKEAEAVGRVVTKIAVGTIEGVSALFKKGASSRSTTMGESSSKTPLPPPSFNPPGPRGPSAWEAYEESRRVVTLKGSATVPGQPEEPLVVNEERALELLGIPKDSPEELIRQRYTLLTYRETDQRRLKELGAAYGLLIQIDEQRRREKERTTDGPN